MYDVVLDQTIILNIYIFYKQQLIYFKYIIQFN